ncbi:MAG: ABC transporter permease subunit [Dehalococcoidia bacterium]|nr:ABC transporter permease subunit [Dehalococcoidia bacterium]
MSQPSPERATGNIYDLGYRTYQGARLGRPYAVLSLYLASLRAAFGLGRRTAAKIMPVALVIIAALPAVIQLGVAAATSDEIELFRAEDYYDYINVVLALFVAAVAPELVGRDLRSRTLSLYFSRALKREDYALGKLAALATAMLFLTLVPQLVMFIGNAFSGSEWRDYITDNLEQIPQIILSAVLLSLFTSAIGLAIAAQTPRRAFAIGGIIAVFVLGSSLGSIITAIMTGDGDNPGNGYPLLASPYALMRGVTYWIFRAEVDSGGELGHADLPLWLYAVAMVAITAACSAYLVRRYRRIAA